ncbi:MAG: O-antigen polymerase family protein [Variovorax sp.]|nr:O-antigen polymerase family protein [Variovorax sp.]
MTSTLAAPAEALPTAAAASFGAALLVAWPFVCPWVGGPSANVWQLLAAWSCVALLLLAGRPAPPAGRLLAWLAALALAIALSPATDAALVLSACAAVAVMGLAAAVGAGMARPGAAGPRALALGLLGAGLASAVLGLLQYGGLGAALAPWSSAPGLGQAWGNLRQRNLFATLLSMALVAGLWLHATGGARARRAWAPAALLLVLALAASASRTGLLQLVALVGAAAFTAWRERQADPAPRLSHPLALLGLLPVYFAASWLLPRLGGPGVTGMLQRLRAGIPANESRLVLWRNMLELIGEHPWRGWGWGELGFAHYGHAYAGPRFSVLADNAHNLPLHLAVELGVPAALALCGGFAGLVWAARPWRERDPARLMAWGVLGAIALHSLLEYPLWYGPFQLAAGLCLGMLWPARADPQTRPEKPLASGRWVLAAAILMAVVGGAAGDYMRVSQLYLARSERLAAYRDDTLAQVRDSWLYAGAVRFAELALAPTTPAGAARVHALARQALHFSPEPRVIVRLIDSARLLGLDDEAQAEAGRFRAAYPDDYARWAAGRPVD